MNSSPHPVSWAPPTPLLFALLLVAGLAGCTRGPDYQRPAAVATMPSAYAGAGHEWKVATPQAHIPKGAWWELFNDPVLNRLEGQAAEANQQLQAAVARFAQARANADVARSGQFPRLGAGVAATRQRDSANRPLSSTGEAADKAYTYGSFTLPFDFSYEVDLWGRVKRQVEAAQAITQASAADVESIRLAIAAEVAADYFTLRALEAEKDTLEASVKTYQKLFELTQNRRAGGLVSDLDVVQAETILRSAEAQLPAIALAHAKFGHALAVLTGQPPSLWQLPPRTLEPLLPTIPAELPSALLERRPDIAAAEQRMAAANANIGIAAAAYFPAIRFNALAGFQSVDAGTLLDGPSRFWAAGPSLSVPLFDGGHRRANDETAKAMYEETVARYRQTVLTAFAEVEDNLAAQRLLAEQAAGESAARQAARQQLAIAQNRYQSGLVSYMSVAAAQTTALERERTVVRLCGQQAVAAVALVKSLGGGWQRAGPGEAPRATPAPTPGVTQPPPHE